MPIYEYECCECKDQFQSLIMNKGEEEDLVCPGCGGRDKKYFGQGAQRRSAKYTQSHGRLCRSGSLY